MEPLLLSLQFLLVFVQSAVLSILILNPIFNFIVLIEGRLLNLMSILSLEFVYFVKLFQELPELFDAVKVGKYLFHKQGIYLVIVVCLLNKFLAEVTDDQ